ncbi:MAG TPA: DUF11 domain-containing protein [Terriglobia bacterium]|nr:DUF11 domain-containing protein [Terriglobia bacterium]
MRGDLHWKRVGIIGVGVLLSGSLGLWAQQPNSAGSVVPRLIQFSGVVKDATGKVVAGNATLTFSLYQFPEGGAPLWIETQAVQADAQGHYTVMLGAGTPQGLPLDLFTSGQAKWLGVTPQLPGVGELPRVLLVGVPYALKAADADTLGGKPASAYVVADSGPPTGSVAQGTTSRTGGSKLKNDPLGTIDGVGTPGFIPLWAGTYTIEDSNLFQSGANLGIGTTTPSATLDVNGTTKFEGLVTFAPGQTFPATNILPTDPTPLQNGDIIPDTSTYYYYFVNNGVSTSITLPHATQPGEVIALVATSLGTDAGAINIKAQSGDVINVPGFKDQTSVPVFGTAVLVSRGDKEWFVQSPSSFPDLTITKTHTGTFFGNGFGTYTLTVSNFGGTATNGTVTVTDTLPTGLTATAFSGTGWTCTLSPLTCTRNDSLGSGASFPALTLTVLVNNSSGTVTNTASVSGGSEVNTANDQAQDVTTLAQGIPQLLVTMTPYGDLTTGKPGTFTITIQNVGTASTNGDTYFNAFTQFTAFDASITKSPPGWSCNTHGGNECDTRVAINPGDPPLSFTWQVIPQQTGASTALVNTTWNNGGYTSTVVTPVTVLD